VRARFFFIKFSDAAYGSGVEVLGTTSTTRTNGLACIVLRPSLDDPPGFDHGRITIWKEFFEDSPVLEPLALETLP